MYFQEICFSVFMLWKRSAALPASLRMPSHPIKTSAYRTGGKTDLLKAQNQSFPGLRQDKKPDNAGLLIS